VLLNVLNFCPSQTFTGKAAAYPRGAPKMNEENKLECFCWPALAA